MKGIGYFISSVSVLLLGLIAWKSDQPTWKSIALALGMLASLVGMLLRFVSHLKEQAAIAYAQREAERH